MVPVLCRPESLDTADIQVNPSYSSWRSSASVAVKIPKLLIIKEIGFVNSLRFNTRSPPVDDVLELKFYDGGALVLTGANSAGKSTFLRMLACFSRPSAGEILWNGHDITKEGVFEQYNYASSNSIGYPSEKLSKTNSMFLIMFNGLKSFKENLVKGKDSSLLARVVALDTPICLLDEPTVALDTEEEVGYFLSLAIFLLKMRFSGKVVETVGYQDLLGKNQCEEG
ncbi:hypothetical protein MKW98_019931 [Papaver atlanticum]|uniref:ABC transporter domain-containing protein n=1 Tax=Papaver atlanticum TaxID=357466 RepID=A0AAD4S0S1_9MAGN|nr:hypothetical protein MKW98_019931 [Papaver atlanticum]